MRSKRQSIVTLSPTETEHVALSNAKQGAIWLQTLLNGMIFDQEKSTTMFEDNEGTIELVKNPSYYLQTKYNDINFHHTPDAVATKKIHLQYCPAQEVIADLLTKGLSRPHTVHL